MLVVIGAGPAGMAAALAAKESGIPDKDIIIIERAKTPGGILEQCIHTGFGLHYFKEEISGPEYAARFIEMLKETDIQLLCDTMVTQITASRKVTAMSKEKGLIEIQADAIILAMGCRERPRGALDISGTRPAGVMTAGTAQQFINIEGYMPGHTCVILGSGDIGLIMARRMTLEGAKVKKVCELLPFSGGLKRNIVQCLNDYNIPLELSTTVVEVHGKDRLTGVTTAKVDENLKPIPGTEEYVECDTLLLSVGLIPENEVSKFAGVTLDPKTKGPVVDDMRETNVKGIFACGNVLQVHDLVDFVTVESQIAGKGAADFIKNPDRKKAYATTKPGDKVNYIVPQKINTPVTDNINFYFRVNNEYRNKKIAFYINGEKVYEKKERKLAPGEMNNLSVKQEILSGLKENDEITISVEEA